MTQLLPSAVKSISLGIDRERLNSIRQMNTKSTIPMKRIMTILAIILMVISCGIQKQIEKKDVSDLSNLAPALDYPIVQKQ